MSHIQRLALLVVLYVAYCAVIFAGMRLLERPCPERVPPAATLDTLTPLP
jgi:hypothetical protein